MNNNIKIKPVPDAFQKQASQLFARLAALSLLLTALYYGGPALLKLLVSLGAFLGRTALGIEHTLFQTPVALTAGTVAVVGYLAHVHYWKSTVWTANERNGYRLVVEVPLFTRGIVRITSILCFVAVPLCVESLFFRLSGNSWLEFVLGCFALFVLGLLILHKVKMAQWEKADISKREDVTMTYVLVAVAICAGRGFALQGDSSLEGAINVAFISVFITLFALCYFDLPRLEPNVADPEAEGPNSKTSATQSVSAVNQETVKPELPMALSAAWEQKFRARLHRQRNNGQTS